jgi:hypothetical protein
MLVLAPTAIKPEEVAGMYGMLADLIKDGVARDQRVARLESIVRRVAAHLDEATLSAQSLVSQFQAAKQLLIGVSHDDDEC